MSNVTTGDLAKIIAADDPRELVDMGKIVAVGPVYSEHDWAELHWRCTSLSGPLVFEWYDDGQPTGEWGADLTIFIPDRFLKRIPPEPQADTESTARPVFEFSEVQG